MSYFGADINTEDFSDSNDVKIAELNYSDPATASYIIDRKSVTFHPSGGTTYSTDGGGTVVRFNIESPSDWLDPSSVRVQFDVVNDGTYTANTLNEQLFLTGGAHSFFKRLRVLSRGIVIHDITEYNRVHELFSYFITNNVKSNELCESIFGTGHMGSVIQTGFADSLTGVGKSTGICPSGVVGVTGNKMTVMFKPFCGLLMQEKYLPLNYAPLYFELELVTSATDPIVKKASKNYDTTTTVYATANVSEKWHLEQFKIRCDLLRLHPDLQNEFDKKLLSDPKNRLSIHLMNHNSQALVMQTGISDLNFNITRALSNLNRVFVSFIKTGGLDRFYSKDYNTFYSTLYANNLPGWNGGTAYTLVSDTFNRALSYNKNLDPITSAQLQIGGKLFPEYPIQSSQEAYYLMKKSMNDNKVFNKHIHAIDITGKSYLSDKFVVVFDTCRVNAGTASYAGLSVRNGANINIRFKLPPSGTVTLPDFMHVILESEATLRILGTYVYLEE